MNFSELELIKYCFRHMCSKEHIYDIFNSKSIKYKINDSYESLSNKIIDEK